MFAQFQLTGFQVLVSSAILCALIAALILGFRHFTKNYSNNDGGAVNVFHLSGMFWLVGLVVSLSLVVLLFNWTVTDQNNQYGDSIFLMDEEILVEPPRSAAPPPPPPPPPPPVIQEVPNTVILDEDQPLFLDQSVDVDALIVAEKSEVPASATAPPPPPPPPPPKTDAPEIFRVVEEMPRFPGCEDLQDMASKRACAEKKLIDYIYSNIQYPRVARENNVEGTVVIQFVVSPEGKIQDAVIVRDVGGGCGQEALRVVNSMKDMQESWIPGKQRGRAVPVLLNLPVRFKLEQL
jgi:protein TonB